MIDMLTSWKGSVDINGVQYENMDAAKTNFKPIEGGICIKLYPKQVMPVKNDDRQVETSVNSEPCEIEITVKKYMTEQSSPGFDFMAKFNNDNPMPLRTMQGTIEKETRGMVYMKLHGVGREEIHCMRCGRSLTNPISRHYGIGPECMQKVGFVGIGIEEVDLIKERLAEVTWEGWIIKSAITEQKEI